MYIREVAPSKITAFPEHERGDAVLLRNEANCHIFHAEYSANLYLICDRAA